MKPAVALLLVLCCVAVGAEVKGKGKVKIPVPFRGLHCTEGPRLRGVKQVDAGLGMVVVTTRLHFAHFLIGKFFIRMSSIRMRHTTVGHAGIWAVGKNFWVYKWVCGLFRRARGRRLSQVDAGRNKAVVGVTKTTLAHCLNSRRAWAFKGKGSLIWNTLPQRLKYISCSGTGACWGVGRNHVAFCTRNINPRTCKSAPWKAVKGPRFRMIEVSSKGRVYGVTKLGKVFRRIGISRFRPHGTRWVLVPVCLKAIHVSFDLGKLWVVSKSGSLLTCGH